jgi:flagellar basal body rod protein FlgG
MMGVLENTRHFESLIRLVQGYDEVMGKAIQRLGEV